MLGKDIKVEAFWDEEAQVWVASSEDVPGLITESDTMEHLMRAYTTEYYNKIKEFYQWLRSRITSKA